MVALITDPELKERLITQRQSDGTDKYDEVWEGMYVMAPLANNEHQDLVNELCTVLTIAVKWAGLGKVYPGVNVSDRKEDWQENFRCPDVAVFLNDTGAEDRGTHWYGGPDVAIEIVSPHDRARQKIPFYAKIGVLELLLIERDPLSIVLYRLQGNELCEAGRSTLEDPQALASHVIPLNWQIFLHERVPAIQVIHHDGEQHWTITQTSH